jgi:hypothetical protein
MEDIGNMGSERDLKWRYIFRLMYGSGRMPRLQGNLPGDTAMKQFSCPRRRQKET